MKKKDAAFKERTRLPVEERDRQALPIQSLIQNKLIYRNGGVSAVGQAYTKLLREHNDTRKVYSVDPFVEVYQFRDNLYGIYCESLDGHGDVWCYLIVGPEKCMLIDTAFGLGDLRGLVEELGNGKPVIVVNTHSHMDHAYGDFQFNEVYLHTYEVPFLEKLDEHLWDYLFTDDGEPIWYDFRREDLIPFQKINFIGVPDGYVFHLGEDYEVELIHLGGHTVGSAAFLDKTNRILFGGDDLGLGMGFGALHPDVAHGECITVAFFLKQVEKLQCRTGEFDYVFPQHGVTEMENVCVEITLRLLQESVSHPTGGNGLTMVEERYRPCVREMDGIRISYHPDQVKYHGHILY